MISCFWQLAQHRRDQFPFAGKLRIKFPVQPAEGDKQGHNLVTAKVTELFEGEGAILLPDDLAGLQKAVFVGDQLRLQLAYALLHQHLLPLEALSEQGFRLVVLCNSFSQFLHGELLRVLCYNGSVQIP